MKQHPILFSAPMVRAILDGTKTQTRRIVTPQPSAWVKGANGRYGIPMKPTLKTPSANNSVWEEEDGSRYENIKCPYGDPDDRLWVKETFAEVGSIGKPIDWFEYQYRADFTEGRWQGDGSMCFDKWKPSIFMPREASRITLEVLDVRVEQLQDIRISDAIAEGIQSFRPVPGDGAPETVYRDHTHTNRWVKSPIESYKTLWQSINGPESWTENPWVWVITFKKI